MKPNADISAHVALDACIDALLEGADWSRFLPTEEIDRIDVATLMTVAEQLLAAATDAPKLEAAGKNRMWQRVAARFSLIRSLALHRLPLLPPLWIRPEAC